MANRHQIAIIVLAAGRSTRMGETNKLLVDFDGKTMIERTLESAVSACPGAVLVVTGYQSNEIRKSLRGFDVSFIDNQTYRDGLSTSLKTGLRELDKKYEGVLVMLADMPQVGPDVLLLLINNFDKTSDICVPVCQGKQGNPVLWGRDYFNDILLLQGDRGAKQLLKVHQSQIVGVEMDADGVLRDFDSPADFTSL